MFARALILANPIAGGGRARTRAPALRAALDAAGIATELRFTERAGDARRLAGGATAPPSDQVVAVGGDGTLNEVLNGLPDPSLPIAQLPLGTANVLATELRLPRKPAALAAAIVAGRTLDLAVGTAGARRFLLFVGAGLDGAMVERLEQVRSGTLGKSRWVAPVLHVVRRLPQHRLRVETDRGEILDDLREVLVTRVRNYGGVFRLTPGIAVGDGLLHVLGFRQRTRLQWLRAAFAAWTGRLRAGVHCEVRTARSLRIEGAEPAPFHVDGDFGGRTPLEIGLLPAPARIVVAPG
jgi:diacylglycerol kinase family enzyme